MRLIALLALTSLVLADPLKNEDTELSIEHAIRVEGLAPVYQKRGTLRQQGSVVSIEQTPFSSQDAQNLVNAVETNGYYYIRIPTNSNEGKKDYVSTLVRACTLVSSKLKDQLTVYYNSKSDSIIGLDYSPSNYTCANKAYLKKIVEGATFKTTMVVNTKGRPGPLVVITPEAQQQQAQQVQAAQVDADGNPVGPQPEDQSLLAKYWMYIVPALFMWNVLMKPAQKEEQTEGARE